MDLKKPKKFYLYNCIHITFPYRGLQKQVNDPWVLWHKAFSWQLLKSVTLVYTCTSKQERSYSGVSLARLEITSRNEEAVNFTRNTIYLLKVFLLPTLSTSILFICLWIGHFRVSKNLISQARLSAKPLTWKWVLIMMQIKLIFTTKVSHLASFWKWDFLELGNGLLI